MRWVWRWIFLIFRSYFNVDLATIVTGTVCYLVVAGAAVKDSSSTRRVSEGNAAGGGEGACCLLLDRM
jgi:hypothetical protein